MKKIKEKLKEKRNKKRKKGKKLEIITSNLVVYSTTVFSLALTEKIEEDVAEAMLEGTL